MKIRILIFKIMNTQTKKKVQKWFNPKELTKADMEQIIYALLERDRNCGCPHPEVFYHKNKDGDESCTLCNQEI